MEHIEHYYSNKYELKPILLNILKDIGIITPACKKAGISRTTFYRWMADDGDFSADVFGAMDMAIEKNRDLLAKIPEHKKSEVLRMALRYEN